MKRCGKSNNNKGEDNSTKNRAQNIAQQASPQKFRLIIINHGRKAYLAYQYTTPRALSIY